MTDQQPPQPPQPPPAAPPAAPPSQAWQAPQDTAWAGGPPGVPGTPGGQWPVAKKTNGLAVTSLVTALAQFVIPIPFALAITAIITGHIARRQTRERNESGSGMALAGLIIGYVSLVLTVLGIIALVLIIALAVPAALEVGVRNDARTFGNRAVQNAVVQNTSPRRADVVRQTYAMLHQTDQCCGDDDITLADGSSILTATDADVARNGGRIEFSQEAFSRKYACLELPLTAVEPPLVVKGRC